MRILGIDPGLYRLGYAIIEKKGKGFVILTSGTLLCHEECPKDSIEDKLLWIDQQIKQLILAFEPSFLSIETQFVQKNVRSAISLSMVRAILLLRAKKHKLSVHQFSPASAKKAVTGIGNATKENVAKMIQKWLSLEQIIASEDESDALCLALCLGFRGIPCTITS